MARTPERQIGRTGEMPAPPSRSSILRTALLASVSVALFIFVLSVAAFLTRDGGQPVATAAVAPQPAPVPAPTPSPAPSTSVGFTTLSDEAVGRGLLGLSEPLAACFDRALRIDPATPSLLRLGLTLRVQADAVVVLEVRGLSAAPAALRRCAEQVLTPTRSAGEGQVGVRDVTVRYRRGRVDIIPR